MSPKPTITIGVKLTVALGIKFQPVQHYYAAKKAIIS